MVDISQQWDLYTRCIREQKKEKNQKNLDNVGPIVYITLWHGPLVYKRVYMPVHFIHQHGDVRYEKNNKSIFLTLTSNIHTDAHTHARTHFSSSFMMHGHHHSILHVLHTSTAPYKIRQIYSSATVRCRAHIRTHIYIMYKFSFCLSPSRSAWHTGFTSYYCITF